MGRERIIPLSSAEDTALAGRIIGSALPPHSILALSGDLGVGKTTFVQGLALALGHEGLIQSPTFIFLHAYEGSILPLFHFDLYRMKSASDFLGLGFDEYFDKGGVCAIEWSEKIAPLLPKRTLFLSFSYHTRGGRTLAISGAFPEKLIESLQLYRTLMRSGEFMCRDFGDRSGVEIESNLDSVNEIEHRFQRRKVDAENFTNQ